MLVNKRSYAKETSPADWNDTGTLKMPEVVSKSYKVVVPSINLAKVWSPVPVDGKVSLRAVRSKAPGTILPVERSISIPVKLPVKVGVPEMSMSMMVPDTLSAVMEMMSPVVESAIEVKAKTSLVVVDDVTDASPLVTIRSPLVTRASPAVRTKALVPSALPETVITLATNRSCKLPTPSLSISQLGVVMPNIELLVKRL